MTRMTSDKYTTIDAAIEASKLGFQPIPVHGTGKAAYGIGWSNYAEKDPEKLRERFKEAAEDGYTNIGLITGQVSGGLVDVDLDHPLALQLRKHLLPPTSMVTGRPGARFSHHWYLLEPTDTEPQFRQYKLSDNATMCVELRSNSKHQTLIPPSIWHDKSGEQRPEPYQWEGEPWGGKEGPAKVDGRVLATQVALLAMVANLLEGWPSEGSRHEAYLALAGGLLRFGKQQVHPFWERNLPAVIGAIVDVTGDRDGVRARVSETMETTLRRIRADEPAAGFPKLGEIIGKEAAESARRRAKDVEVLAGFSPEVMDEARKSGKLASSAAELDRIREEQAQRDELISTLPPEKRNPLEERVSSWEAVDLDPYLNGDIDLPKPSVLRREDGQALLYPGRVNMLFGKSEAAKSWISLYAACQEISIGQRVLYLDFEDEPAATLGRLISLGMGDEDIKANFAYVRPEGPIAQMERNRFGSHATTDAGEMGAEVFKDLLEDFDPTLIVADGMTVIYGLHGLDTNDATSTDVVTSWLKSLTRGGRSTVIVIDHTGKAGGAGSSPIGAQHKTAMVQGCSLRADAVDRPMPGAVGTINLMVYKDRPGEVRKIGGTPNSNGEQLAAIVVMDSTKEGVVDMRLEVPSRTTVTVDDESGGLAEAAVAHEYLPTILKLFHRRSTKSLATSEVASMLALSPEEVRQAWRMLHAKGFIEKTGDRRWTRYELTSEGVAELEALTSQTE